MARFALFTNGVKVETLDELRENYNISDMLQNFESKALHRWLASNCLLEELTKLEKINSNISDEVNSVLMDILGVPESIKQEFLKKKQQEQKQRENALNYSDSIARLKELSAILQQVSYSEAEVDEFITLPVSTSEFIKELKQIPQLEVIVSKVKALALTNISAKVKLGTLYATGVGVEKNDDLAFIFYEQAAEAGDSFGMNCLANCYNNGKGCTKDSVKYIDWLKKSAALQNPVAICNLGKVYCLGEGVEKSYDKGNEFFVQSSQMGYAWAYNNLGWNYEQGNGVEKNLNKAFELYKIAAEADCVLGQRNLGYCYQYGNGTEIDMSQAYRWYSRAAEIGDSVAQCKVGHFLQYGWGDVAKDETQAVEWYKKAADQNNAEAQCYLGICYYCGISVERDIDRALELYEKSANCGYTFAMNSLGDIFFNEDDYFDAEKALCWYNKAIENGDKEACLKKFEVLFYNGLNEYGFDFLNIEALNTLLDAYNKKVPGAEAFICFFKYMQYTFEKNSLQQDEEFERIMEFFTENCFDFDDSIEAWFSALLSEAANDVEPALLVLGMLIIGAEEDGEDLSQLTGVTFDTNDAKDFLEKAANKDYRLAKKLLKNMEENVE